MAIKDSIKNAALSAGGLIPAGTNAPTQYKSKQTQYFADESMLFRERYARYSSDFVEARVQGLEPNAPYAWGIYRLRLTDIVRPRASLTKRIDNLKLVLFERRDVEYIRPGTKIVTMGSTWLVTNPINVSGSDGSGIVQRCNAVWNHLDFYGNVVSEPIVVENARADANDSDYQESGLATKGYFNVIAQMNDDTRQLGTNSRLILGSAAWRITGYSDFQMEFTGDYDSVRLLEFSIRFEQPNDELDDMVNHVAEGKTFAWEISVNGPQVLNTGASAAYRATSAKNGEAVNESKHPCFYIWQTSDETVATVDAMGNVTGVGAGECTIRCTLAQNPSLWAETALTVQAADTSDRVAWVEEPSEALSILEETTFSAAFFDGGVETEDELEWTFTGPNQTAYGVLTGPKAATVYCYEYSATPLTVTARHGAYSVSAVIQLRGA